MNSQEQACWFTLVFESKLSMRVINDILVIWCKQLERTLEDFFVVDTQEWRVSCHLKEEFIQKLEVAKEKLVAQTFLVEQLQRAGISMMTVLDAHYPKTLKQALDRTHIPSILFYAGNLEILRLHTIAIIGSRHASENSLKFTRAVAHYLADNDVNVISGHAPGVDRAAYEGATETNGHTTVVLPHGMRKLSKVQLRDLQPRIEEGKVLLLSQFHPDASWLVSRAMERNNVVTGLAQVVIVAESDTKGGTWEGANGALKQKRQVFVRQADEEEILQGNRFLIEKGGKPIPWPTTNSNDTFASLLEKAQIQYQKQYSSPSSPNQMSLLAVNQE